MSFPLHGFPLCWFSATSVWIHHFIGLVQDCSISKVLPVEILQTCARPSTYNKATFISPKWHHFRLVKSLRGASSKHSLVFTQCQFWPLGIVIACVCLCVHVFHHQSKYTYNWRKYNNYLDCFMVPTFSQSPSFAYTYICRALHGPDCLAVSILCIYTDLCN